MVQAQQLSRMGGISWIVSRGPGSPVDNDSDKPAGANPQRSTCSLPGKGIARGEVPHIAQTVITVTP